MKKIRLFIAENGFGVGAKIKIENSDFDYLTKVMRKKIADQFLIFNGVDGEFIAEISSLEKKFLLAEIKEKFSDLKKVPNITLAFAPVKNVRIDFVAAKAAELGVARFQPILTQHTIVDKINLERFKSNVKEACEQCERNDFPEILEIKKLEKFLREKESEQKLFILCDESGQGSKASEVLLEIAKKNLPLTPTLSRKGRGSLFEVDETPSPLVGEGWGEGREIVILVGPEGGFSKEEFAQMRQLKNLYSISLGPRILRADTAIISALTLVQEFCGDFNLKPNFL